VENVIVRSEPLTYREGGAHSFFQDRINAEVGDEKAAQRLDRHGVEMRINPNGTAGTGGEFSMFRCGWSTASPVRSTLGAPWLTFASRCRCLPAFVCSHPPDYDRRVCRRPGGPERRRVEHRSGDD
jgi:hypothetical protein